MNEISLGGRRMAGFSLGQAAAGITDPSTGWTTEPNPKDVPKPKPEESVAPFSFLLPAAAGAVIVGVATAGISYASTGKLHGGRVLVAALAGAVGGGVLGAATSHGTGAEGTKRLKVQGEETKL